MCTHIPHRSHSDYLIIEGLSCHINNNQNACHSMGTFSSTRCIIRTAPWSLFYINRLFPVYIQKKNKNKYCTLIVGAPEISSDFFKEIFSRKEHDQRGFLLLRLGISSRERQWQKKELEAHLHKRKGTHSKASCPWLNSPAGSAPGPSLSLQPSCQLRELLSIHRVNVLSFLRSSK